MNTQLTRIILGISFGIFLFSGTGLAAEPAEVGKFVKARIEISEMMMNYFFRWTAVRKGRTTTLTRCDAQNGRGYQRETQHAVGNS